MNNHLNWDHLRFFIEVTKAGSVVKAAASLGVSHATALRNISRLEDSLGIKLFDRLQSGYQVTLHGEELLQNALAMQKQAEVLTRRATGENPEPEGLLRLVVPDSSLFDLIPLVEDFRSQYPRILLRADRGMPNAIGRSESDVAFAITNHPPDALVGRQIQRIEFSYYASPEYLAAAGDGSVTPAECDWIVWNSEAPGGECDAEHQEAALRQFSRQPNIVLQTASHEDALSAVRLGMGIALLKIPQPDLVQLPFKSTFKTVGVWMLTHQELRRSGRIQAFMDYVASRFSKSR